MTDSDRRAELAVASHRAAIEAYCRRRLPPAAVADAAAEVMAVVWRRRDVLPPEPETLPWMYGVARRVVLGVARSERRWAARRRRLAGVAAPVPDSADSAAIRLEEERQVREALTQLREGDREVLRLAAWEGLGNREIARVLGISPAAADQRLSRAKRRLAARFAIVAKGDHS